MLEINPEPRSTNSTNSTEVQPLKLHETVLYRTLQTLVQKLHGDFGSAAIRPGFVAKYCNELTRIAIIKCRRGPHKLLTSVIPFITHLDQNRVSVNILYVGATLKNCFNFIRLYQQKKCDEICAGLDSQEMKQFFKNSLMDFKRILNIIGNWYVKA